MRCPRLRAWGGGDTRPNYRSFFIVRLFMAFGPALLPAVLFRFRGCRGRGLLLCASLSHEAGEGCAAVPCGALRRGAERRRRGVSVG